MRTNINHHEFAELLDELINSYPARRRKYLLHRLLCLVVMSGSLGLWCGSGWFANPHQGIAYLALFVTWATILLMNLSYSRDEEHEYNLARQLRSNLHPPPCAVP